MDEVEAGEILLGLDREQSRRSFERFARLAWSVVEPNPCVWNWHMSAICQHLEAVSRGDILDLVICVPPGSSKTLLTTLWEAWDWLAVDPTRRTIAASYGQELSEKSARLLRALLDSDWWISRWPHLAIDPRSEDRIRMFRLRSRGWRFSTSVAGAALGYHADVLLGDDLSKVPDEETGIVDPVDIKRANEFWFGKLHTRRANPIATRRVLIGQRIHHSDTPGAAIEAGYTALVLPMEFDPKRVCHIRRTGFKDPRTEPGELLNPERFTREVLDADLIAMRPQKYAAQMNQDPPPGDGVLFKRVLDHRWIPDKITGLAPTGGRTIITADCTFKGTADADNVSIQVWRQIANNYLLLHRVNRKMTASETVKALFATTELYPGASVYVEDKANGTAIIDMFRDALPLVPWDPGTSSKYARAQAKAELFEIGRALVPPDSHAPWVASYAAELQRFPFAKHDDDVDATTMALLILDSGSARRYVDAMAKLRAELSGYRGE